jgi:hypothetical protein
MGLSWFVGIGAALLFMRMKQIMMLSIQSGFSYRAI